MVQILPRAAAGFQQVGARLQAGQEGGVGLADEGGAGRQRGSALGGLLWQWHRARL